MAIDRTLVRAKNNGTQNAFVRDVIGSKADTAAAGAVTSTDTMMAYVKQLVTNVLSDSAVVGALADAAASGAVTSTDTVMAYIKQLVTEGIARDLALGVIDGFFDVPTADVATNTTMRDVVGNKTDAAASGAVSAVESIMAYVKQVVTGLIVLDEFHDVPAADNALNAQMNEVLGNKEDAAVWEGLTTTQTLVAMAKGVSRKVMRTSYVSLANTDLTGTATRFTVSLGSILVRHLQMRIITGLPAGANTMKFSFTPSGGGATDLSDATDTASAAENQLFVLDGVKATGLVKCADPGIMVAAAKSAMPIVLTPGVIQTIFSAGPPASGAAFLEMQWEPLTAGATVA